MRCLPVVTLNSFWGFLLCIYRDGLVVEFFEVWVGGATAVTAGGFGVGVTAVGGVWVGGCCGVFVLVGAFLRCFCHVFFTCMKTWQKTP